MRARYLLAKYTTQVLIGFILLVILILFPPTAEATIWLTLNWEGQTCGALISDEYVDGGAAGSVLADSYESEGGAPAYIRCSTPVVSGGNNYLEHQHSSSQADLIEYYGGSMTHNLVSGTTYYIGGYYRFERIGGNDIWNETDNSWDKLFEMSGSGFRWGVGSGSPNGTYTIPNHKFTWDLWCASSIVSACPGAQDHKVQNTGGYNASSPYLSDYDRWYAVILGVTYQTGSIGRWQLWVNGTLIIDGTGHGTGNSGATFTTLRTNGTVAQTGYDAPTHKRQYDKIIVSNSWSDMVAAGLTEDPQGGGGGPSVPNPPTNLRVE